MKIKLLANLLFFSLLIFSSCVFAQMESGLYLGAGVGGGVLLTPCGGAFNPVGTGLTNTRRVGGLSGRAFIGLKFSRFIGIEAGYAGYAQSRYKATQDGLTSYLIYNATAADIVGKLYFPLGHSNFSIYALGGMARFMERIQFINNGIAINTARFAQPTQNGTVSNFRNRPIYGLGVLYEIPCHVGLSLQYSIVQNLGNFRQTAYAIPNAELLTLNVFYNYG